MSKTGNSRKKRRNYCQICNKIIKGSSFQFKAHLFKHDAVKARHKCKFCSKEFFRTDTFIRHIQSHTGRVVQKKYICDHCDRAFVNKSNLIIHLKRIHDDGRDKNSPKFTCDVCNVGYCESRMLHQHIRRVHFDGILTKEPCHLKKLINETWIERVISTNTCVRMTKVNTNIIVIKRLKTDRDIKTEVAKAKTMEYKSESVDQYSKAICDYCRKEMIKKSLRLHIQEIHMNLRKFSCAKCKGTFKRHYQLVDHKCGQVKRQHKKSNV